MSYTDGITGESREASFANTVSSYFDEDGYICNEIFDTEVLKLQNSLTDEKKSKWIWQRCLLLLRGVYVVIVHTLISVLFICIKMWIYM